MSGHLLRMANRPPTPAAPSGALVTLSDALSWQTIRQDRHQVVLYNPESHAIAVQPSTDVHPSESHGTELPICPYCRRALPISNDSNALPGSPPAAHASYSPNYFKLLAVANEASSRPVTPPRAHLRPLGSDTMAQGYFSTFFKEECRLGMGANGTVFLCQVC